ncbi:MAG: ATP-binding protein, partial [Nitrososphaeria archaeon]
MDTGIAVAWSGGKDSCMSLHQLKKSFEIHGLITTITEDYGRVSMHGVRVELLEEQASSLGVPLYKVLISKDSTNQEYEEKMRDCLLKLKAEGVTKIAYGDIFLQDVKDYREKMLRSLNMEGLFPLWKMNTKELISNF